MHEHNWLRNIIEINRIMHQSFRYVNNRDGPKCTIGRTFTLTLNLNKMV
jgi:hypothetical protein